jgi:surface protein
MKRLMILLALLVLLAAGFADDAFGKIIARASTGDFVSTWKTDNPGTSEDNQITLPLESTGTYDFVAYWGDGTFDEITAYNDAAVTHTYPAAGTYTVRIIGEINGWRFNNTGDKSKITDISQWGDLFIGNSGGYFYGCNNLNVTATDVLDVSSVTSFSAAFFSCTSLTTLDVSSWDVSSVTTFHYAFNNCSSLTTLDVSSWDVSSVTTFYAAFSGCSSLTTLDVSGWDVSSVTTFSFAFYNCSSLTTLDVSRWDVSSVTTLYFVFRGCSSLTTLDVSSWDVSSVTTLSYAFYNCSSLTTLDVSSWDVSSVTTLYYAFYNCSSLTTLDVSSWQIPLVADMTNMLTGTTIDNYSTVLINFAAQSPALQDSVVWGAGANTYDSTAVAAKAVLTETHYWTITDGGLE